MGRDSFLSGYKTYDPEKEGYGNRNQWKSAFKERMNIDEAREHLEKEAKVEGNFRPLEVRIILLECKTFEALHEKYRSLIMDVMKRTNSNPTGDDLLLAQTIVATYTVLKKEKFDR